jgi:ubiquinone/menaquinone biosynthesis C-methylase UbiE
MSEHADRYTHGHHESVLRSHRWRTAENSAAFLLPHLRPGLSLLDIGCGPGNITADLADRVAPGPTVGIDLPADVIAAAAVDHVRDNLIFRVDDVYALDIDDDTYDVVYAHQVLQHLSDPVAALKEMRRVATPGGLVAVRDSDYGAFVWSPADPVLTRWNELYHELTRHNRAEADAGRYLHTWVRSAGFDDIELSHSAWTFQSETDRAWWGGVWADRALQSEFARQCLEYGLCDAAELQSISDAFRRWAAEPEGLFVLLHGEVLARK